jgi:hypothetical protein
MILSETQLKICLRFLCYLLFKFLFRRGSSTVSASFLLYLGDFPCNRLPEFARSIQL